MQERDWNIRGLRFGSRGTFGDSVEIFNKLNLETLNRTIRIHNSHIYA